MTCPACYGFGFVFSFLSGKKKICDACSGIGKGSSWVRYGLEMKTWRESHGMTLRQASRKYNIDPSNLSKMERGLIKPKRYWS